MSLPPEQRGESVHVVQRLGRRRSDAIEVGQPSASPPPPPEYGPPGPAAEGYVENEPPAGAGAWASPPLRSAAHRPRLGQAGVAGSGRRFQGRAVRLLVARTSGSRLLTGAAKRSRARLQSHKLRRNTEASWMTLNAQRPAGSGHESRLVFLSLEI